MVHSALVASIASPTLRRTLTAVEQPRAPIAHPLCGLEPYDVVRQRRPMRTKIAKRPEESAQPFEKARFVEGKSLDFPSPGLDFPSPGLDFPSLWLGFPSFGFGDSSFPARSGEAARAQPPILKLAIAAMLTMSESFEPRDTICTGFSSPTITGPITVAPPSSCSMRVEMAAE
jgi:hypothetical protein